MIEQDKDTQPAAELKNWPPATSRTVLYVKEDMIGLMTAMRFGPLVRVVSYCPRRNIITTIDFDDAAAAHAKFLEAIQISKARGHEVFYDGPPLVG